MSADKDLPRNRAVLDNELLAKIAAELDKRQGNDLVSAVYEVRVANNMTPSEFYPYYMAWSRQDDNRQPIAT